MKNHSEYPMMTAQKTSSLIELDQEKYENEYPTIMYVVIQILGQLRFSSISLSLPALLTSSIIFLWSLFDHSFFVFYAIR